MIDDRWSGEDAYERFMGRWSRKLAAAYLPWLEAPRRAHWLEVGSGTGALTAVLLKRGDPASVLAVDPAEPFLEEAGRRIQDPRVRFAVAGSGTLPARDGGYGVIVSLLALNFFPDPAAGVKEFRARAAPGGLVSACVWDYAGRMDFLRVFWDAAISLDPSARGLDEGVRFPVCEPVRLTSLFEDAGFANVECEPLEIETRFADFPDFWDPLLGATGPAPAFVASLDEDGRRRLAAILEARLPSDSRGRIPLTARAFAVRGIA